MRIVYVLNSLAVGGTERQVLALASRMKARGHSVALMVLLAAASGDLETDLDVVRLELTKFPGSLIGALHRGSRFLSSCNPDLLHSHNFHGNMMARLLRLAHRRQKLISTIHNVYEGGPHRMLAYRLTGPLAHRITAVSHAVAERYVRLHAARASKCVVISNAIDVQDFVPDTRRRLEMRTHMGVSDEFIWMTAGRAVPAKDYPNLLRAFAEVQVADPGAQLWIAGDKGIGVERPSAGIAMEKSVMERVRWLGVRRDIPALLDASDGFVLASAWEGMPLALGEALAMEKPAVATDVGGIRELVADTARIVPPGDSRAIADAMLATMNTPQEERRSQGRAARERVCVHFNMDARAAQWESIYRSLLA